MAKDPYKYFRVEARELLDELTHTLLEIEQGIISNPTVIAKLLRLAHTLKGAAHVVKQTAIAESAHALEDILAPFRESAQSVPPEQAGQALQKLDEIAEKLALLVPPADTPEAGTVSPPRSREALETVRVELGDLEALLSNLAETGVQVTAMRTGADAIRMARESAAAIVRQLEIPTQRSNGTISAKVRACAGQLLTDITRAERSWVTSIERTERELVESQERASRLRLLPFERIVPAMARACREAATAVAKRAQLETSGGDIRMDADVLALLQDALLHLVRNALVHGIEDEKTRAGAGKQPLGRVEVRAERRGGRVLVVCSDDGAGIDIEAIRKAAVRKGAICPSAAGTLEVREAIDLILRRGVSTANAVTATAGRGIGLDVVRDAVERLKGEISIETVPGRGTTVQISVPISLTSIEALLIRSFGVTAAIPLSAISQTLRIGGGDLASSGPTESIPCQGTAIPFLPISTMLGTENGRRNGLERKTAVVIRSGEKLAAIGVEKLLGTRSVLVRSLSPITASEAFVAGASLDSEGIPLLVLDPAGLVEAICHGRSHEMRAGKKNLPVLIVDDSLTTRMVEQNILESAGYEVEAASSGEDALHMAHLHNYGLFVVDIEMPGMDGFQFVARARGDQELREVPSILVSSRSSPEDQHRGEEAGARAYFVKSEFDQTAFLETVAQLLE